MPSQLIGVSPPLVGKAQDSKVDLKKDFNDASPREYKNDFEKTLKEKLALKEKAKDNEKEKVASAESLPPKEARLKKDGDKESKVEEKEEKSSGGTKKKMTDQVDDQMISKFMASNESEVEIPESKTDLAEIKESQPNQNQVALAVASGPLDIMSLEAVASASETSAVAPMEVALSPEEFEIPANSLPTELADKIKALQAQPTVVANEQGQVLEESVVGNEAKVTDVQNAAVATTTGSLVFQPDELIQKIKALEAAPADQTESTAPSATVDLPKLSALFSPLEAAPQIEAQPIATLPVLAPQALTVDQELAAIVGFQSESKTEPAKVFEGEKVGETQKSQDFQKSVYDQLQKMDSRQPTAALQSNMAGSEKDPSQQHEELPQKSLKSDTLMGTELQHAGQSHGEFKSQLAAAPVASGSELQRAQLLEQNHEKNIQEVMNQAQYLIKKGGGEMKVTMSPDGLAEVQMKVMLQDGKVNIEMSTQDKTVKKLIEESLTDLRSSLAAQHLTIDHVKINSVTATNTDNSAQFQSNWNGSGAEHKQREFWTQFQDNMSQNNSKRSGYGSNANGNVQSTQSSSSEAPVNALRTYGGTKGSQVNRVA